MKRKIILLLFYTKRLQMHPLQTETMAIVQIN